MRTMTSGSMLFSGRDRGFAQDTEADVQVIALSAKHVGILQWDDALCRHRATKMVRDLSLGAHTQPMGK